MPRLTLGFVTTEKLRKHFRDHKNEFGATTQEQYEALADMFLGGPLGAGVRDCTRANGDYCRCNPSTGEYGILDDSRHIITFMILGHNTVARRRQYFLDNC